MRLAKVGPICSAEHARWPRALSLGIVWALAAACAGCDSDPGLHRETERLGGYWNLSTVMLSGTSVTDSDLERLGPHMAPIAHLHLWLGHTAVGDVGIRHLRCLADNLEMLAIGDTRVTDEGLKELTYLGHLSDLTVGSSRVTDAGMVYVGKIVSLWHLTVGCEITDVGLEHLAGLRELRWLELRFAPAVTDEGLMRLRTLHHLNTLFLPAGGHARITAAGIRRLRRDLPGLKVWQGQEEVGP